MALKRKKIARRKKSVLNRKTTKNAKLTLVGKVYRKTLDFFNKYKVLVVLWSVKGILGVALAGLIAFSIHKSLPTIKGLFGEGALFNTFKFVYEELEVPDFKSFISPDNDNFKKISVKRVLILRKSNTILLSGSIDFNSVAKIMQEANRKNLKLRPGIPFYLVIDTPGGFVEAGKNLISFLQALPRKVHTLAINASSMGFHIAQNLNKRYVLKNGYYMSHNIIVPRISGQWGGELEAQIKNQKKLSDYSNYVASKRMGISLKEYEKFIKNNVTIFAYEAVKLKVADEVVLARCDKSLDGTIIGIETHPYTHKKYLVKRSECPLIKGVLKATPLRGIRTKR